MSFNTQIAETMTFNIIKQTIAFLEKNDALKVSRQDVLNMLTAEMPEMPKSRRGRPSLSQEAREAKKQAAAELKAEKVLAREADKLAAAELKEEKALAREAKKVEAAFKATNPRPRGRSPKGQIWSYQTGTWIDGLTAAV